MPVPVPVALAVGAFFVGVGAFGSWAEARTRRAMREHWRRVGEELGLSMSERTDGEAALDGQIDGNPVSVRQVLRHTGEARRFFTRIQIRLDTSLPDGLEIRRPVPGGSLFRLGRVRHKTGNQRVDGHYAIYGPDSPHTRTLVGWPGFASALETAARRGVFVTLDDHLLQLDQVGRGLDDLDVRLQLATTVARALCQASEAPWREAMERFGLRLEDEGPRMLLEGRTAGGTLRVLTRVDQEPLPTRLTFRFREDIGPPFSITGLVDASLDRGVQLSDPVLDGLISVNSLHPQRTRELLRRPDLRGPLLAVVHAFPLSRVSEREIILHLEALEPSTLSERIEDVLDLAQVLTAPSPSDTPV